MATRAGTLHAFRRRANRQSIILAALGLLCLASPAQAQAGLGRPDLTRYAAGPLPPEFLTTWRTGQGALGDWKAVEDASAPGGKAIEQSRADATDYRYPLAVYEPLAAQNVEASVRFKAVSGREDQAGGRAVRLADADNYYVVRANALEDNIRLYRVVRGDRQQIGGASAKVSSSEWHTLALTAQGPRLAVSFDGKLLFTVEDRTFSGLGKVALWTKADSVTRFTDLRITPLP